MDLLKAAMMAVIVRFSDISICLVALISLLFLSIYNSFSYIFYDPSTLLLDSLPLYSSPSLLLNPTLLFPFLLLPLSPSDVAFYRYRGGVALGRAGDRH